MNPALIILNAEIVVQSEIHKLFYHVRDIERCKFFLGFGSGIIAFAVAIIIWRYL